MTFPKKNEITLPTTKEIKEVKDYLRLEGDEDDYFIQTLILAAKEDLADSGVTNQETERYKIAVKLMVANFYEQRKSFVVGQTVSNIPYSLERIILQLKADELGDSS